MRGVENLQATGDGSADSARVDVLGQLKDMW
jgi:hypothetical protein